MISSRQEAQQLPRPDRHGNGKGVQRSGIGGTSQITERISDLQTKLNRLSKGLYRGKKIEEDSYQALTRQIYLIQKDCFEAGKTAPSKSRHKFVERTCQRSCKSIGNGRKNTNGTISTGDFRNRSQSWNEPPHFAQNRADKLFFFRTVRFYPVFIGFPAGLNRSHTSVALRPKLVDVLDGARWRV